MRKRGTRIAITSLTLVVLSLAGMARAGELSPDAKAPIRFRLEVKREATNRGSPDESSKTQVKLDAMLDGIVSLLRLEMPFPDGTTSFEGDPFSPRLGDVKARIGFRHPPLGGVPVSSFVEATFPTADPGDLGSGKYQISGGIRPTFSIPLPKALEELHRLTFGPLVKQVVSVAGEEDRKSINYTKLELDLKDTWRKAYWAKLTLKPVVDWQQGGRTGAVGELEVGWEINRHWSIWLMLGTRLWGEKVPSTYDQRVGINGAVQF
jgi:hypothetical protein